MIRPGARDATTLRLAHRGDWRQAPENTVRALELALDLATCDGLEFDVIECAAETPYRCPNRHVEYVRAED